MFLNEAEFSKIIENIVKDKGLSHFEAVLEYCKENEIEPDEIKKLVSKSLKDKIEVNARALNYLPKVAVLDV